ncbi:MAG: GNAT family N-acetyltransferase [Gammaproteobacteria bacterium]|nr:GNAT family N-acetyltransferase [Gammaproteobacteria bacterium]
MKQLRTHLVEEEFFSLMKELMDAGYQLAYLEQNKSVVCVAGFKVSKNLFLGKNLYVEDLVSDESQRSRGYGKQMMDWLRQYAIGSGCQALHLDSGVQRHGAHKFYLNQNMDIVCYHFLERIS